MLIQEVLNLWLQLGPEIQVIVVISQNTHVSVSVIKQITQLLSRWPLSFVVLYTYAFDTFFYVFIKLDGR